VPARGFKRLQIRKTDEKLDRYFQAFEAGTMAEGACAARVAALGDQLRSLRSREAELRAAVEDQDIAEPISAELAEVRAMVTEGLRDAPIPQRKAIMQKFVSEVRVQSRTTIHPVFRLPLRGVREVFRLVDPGEQYVNPDPEIGVAPIDLTGWAEPIERWRRQAGGVGV